MGNTKSVKLSKLIHLSVNYYKMTWIDDEYSVI